jgi:CHAT domain-containing protein/Tfp pilus assembly protein PilF
VSARPRRARTLVLALVGLLASSLARAQAPAPGAARPFSGLLPAEEREVASLDRDVVRLIDAGRLAEGAPAATRLLALRTRQMVALEREIHNRSDAGRPRDAIPLAEQLLSLRRTILGPEHADSVAAVGLLAQLHRRTGNFRAAEPLFQQVIALRERTLGVDHRQTAYAWLNVATLYQESGERDLAEPLFLRVLAAAERSPGAGSSELLRALDALASFYRHTGDLDRAEPLYRRALAIAEKESPEGSGDVSALLDNLACVVAERRDPSGAAPLFQRALTMSEAVHGADDGAVGRVLNNLATFELRIGDLDRAEAHFQRSRSIREKLDGPDHPDVATVLYNGSVIPRYRGDLAGARAMLERALAILEKAYGPDHPRVADVLDALAELRAATGEAKAAVELRGRASAIEDRNAETLLSSGSEEQKRLYMERLRQVTSGTLSLHLRAAPEDPAAAELALGTLLRRKGRVLDAVADGLSALRRELGPDAQPLLDGLTAINGQIAAQIARAPGDAPLAEQRAELAALEAERRKVEVAVSARSRGFAREQRGVSVAALRALLPDDAALVEIALYAPLNFQAKRREDRWGRARYAAYLLRRSGAISSVDLGEADALDAAVKALREALADPNHDARPAARALDARILAPLRPLLGDARRVLLSPDGELTLVPFAALVDEQGRFALEQRSFSYLSSGRDLLRFKDERPARQGALLVAAPAFDAGSAAPPGASTGGRRSIDMGDVSFRALSGTAREARAIEQELPGARLLLGAAATEAAIKAVEGPSLLHIATHGFFLPRDERPAASALGAPLDEAPALSRESPLLRSGLAFAGANLRRSGADDGILTALEASSLDLDGTALVVLSACDSGVGESSRGEGVYGLRRALVIAGAATQVMSLWRVDDEATRDLMIAYYGALRAGEGRGEAMRRAQRALLARPEMAHPFFWASFIVSGDDAPLPAGLAASIPAKTSPGPRGCACATGGDLGASRGPIAAFVALLLASFGRPRVRACDIRRGGRRLPLHEETS